MGVDSAYRAFLMPHRLLELQHTLDPQFWRANEAWLEAWTHFARAILGSGGCAPNLLLKSPNHSFRLPAFLNRLPNAKVVWLIRSPDATLASNRKMWLQMFATHGLSDPSVSALDSFLQTACIQAASVLLHLTRQLPPSALIVCRPEDVRSNPLPTLESLLSRLDMHSELSLATRPELEEALKRTAKGRVELYPQRDESAEMRNAMALLCSAQETAWETHGLHRGT